MAELETKPLFPHIGSLADQADQEPDSTQTSDEAGKIIQQVESLCMKCGEQVREAYLLGILYF